MKFNAFIKNCKVIYDDFKLLETHLRGLQDKKVTVEIKKYKKSRSNNQNRYYWFVLKLLSEYTGYTSNELHDFFKLKLLRSPVDGWMKFKIISTTKLNTEEFECYLEQIRRFASTEIGYYLPLPNETQYDYDFLIIN